MSASPPASAPPPAAPAWRPAEPFPLSAPLTGSPLNRAAELRNDPTALARLAGAAETRTLLLWRGKLPIALGPEGPRLAWAAPSSALSGAAREDASFLGACEGRARFAADLSDHDDPAALGLWAGPPKFIDLRSIGTDLPPPEAAIVAEAKALLDWHGAHRRCARCGGETAPASGGWRRACGACGADHFPRTDPVTIMLATRRGADGVERVIIGRQPNWPERMHSLLAGYVEPGETLEEAARRETIEEAGVAVGRAGYLTCQPWPFPSTLMIGMWVDVLSDALTPDREELESCRWATKAEVREALAGRHPEFDAPRRDAIARTLLRAWAEDRLDLSAAATGAAD